MDLKPVILILIKILTSTSTIIHATHAAAALMGGHIDNNNNQSTSSANHTNRTSHLETIPDPSPLVLPGYNLPENIFNQGKPFYVKKDPETGHINFNQKTSSSSSNNDNDHDNISYDDYINDDEDIGDADVPLSSSDDIYDKKNIDRKDGSYASHRPNDVNQLTPNFHNYLNLPTKYNPEKYVYPLISNSYASTKIQGSVNKFHNHKDTFGVVKTTIPNSINGNGGSSTIRPPATYYTPRTTRRTVATTPVSTTTSIPSSSTSILSKLTTMKIYPELTTTQSLNLLNSGMSHPSFTEEYEYYDTPVESTTKKTNIESISTTTIPISSTTTKSMSLFEQLFGSFDDELTTTTTTTTTERLIKTTAAAANTMKPISSSTTEMIYDEYPDDNDDYMNSKLPDNIAVENNAFNTIDDSLSMKLKPDVSRLTTTSTTSTTAKSITSKSTPATTATTLRVTSLPLGDNHIVNSMPSFKHRDPIIVATQNLRDKLNDERVPIHTNLNAMVPSSSNIHIAPDQDTVSFVVGHHQSVGSGDEGQYIGTAIKESPYDNRPFKPFYGHDGTVSSSDLPVHLPQRSEATLSVKMPFIDSDNAEELLKNGQSGVVPGKVITDMEVPKNKIVFPKDDQKPFQSNLITSKPEKQIPKKDVLPLNSEPLFHQLPSDLTPPKKDQDPIIFPRPSPGATTRYESNVKHINKPPWDPRPGHFYNGKPEYARPPRPPPPQQGPSRSDIAYKRIDNLPNILPQFRPNKYYNNAPPPPQYYDQRFHRQPLLERPSNRPVGFFEKLAPPPPPPPPPPPQSYNNFQRRNGYVGPSGPLQPPRQPPLQGQIQPELDLYQTPPNIEIPGMKKDREVETLQMIQVKNEKDIDRRNDEENDGDNEQQTVKNIDGTVRVVAETDIQNLESNNNKTIYRVYPVKTAPIHLDTINNDVKDDGVGVVIGTRLQELPLPPSKIDNDFNYQITDRNDAPILKPHIKTINNGYPLTKIDFPYPLEKPPNNQLDDGLVTVADLESRIVTTGVNKNKYEHQMISATLKTYTDKPIAIAYTPTGSTITSTTTTTTDLSNLISEKYSMPNYGRPVIPEIRTTGVVENADTGYSSSNNNHPLHSYKSQPIINHRIDISSDGSSSHLDNLNFQAPFHASIKLDPISISDKGWSVVVRKNNTKTNEKNDDDNEITTITNSSGGSMTTTIIPYASTSEFDIENFKPQLIGGFKPIYKIPEKIDNNDDENNR